MTRFRILLCGGASALVWLAAAPAQNAGALNPPAPLARATANPSAGVIAMTLANAQRAQDLGLPLLAVDLYRKARDVAGADRDALTLALATALLDAGEAAEAEKVLAEIPEPRGAAWHLRAGLAAVQLRKIDVARAELAAIKESELPESDYPWYWFFQGEMVDLAPVRDITRANNFYDRAERGAATELARAQFQLAAERLRLRAGTTDLKLLKENYDRNAGTQTGYDFAVTYAIALDAAGQKSQAVTFLQAVLVPLPRQERNAWDWLRLVLGIIGDKSRTGAGRHALNQVVENGLKPERQRQALQLLVAASGTEAERRALRDLLKRLIDAKLDHPIKESLFFYRAQLALTEKDFAQAEVDANALLSQFPRSTLRVHALGVLTQSAWEQGRFRLAANFAQNARAEFAPGGTASGGLPAKVARARLDLGVLEAEARFRAGLSAVDRNDFRLAADAYATVLRERPMETEPGLVGALMFQRVLAEIKSGSGEAGKILDQLAADPAFDIQNRWDAEWSLARALQLQGPAGVKEAYARVNLLLREPEAGATTLNPELRARMAWLQARLAFESNEPEQTIQRVMALVATPFAIAPDLKTEIESTAVLLKARAEFALGQEPVALETLKLLREKYAMTDAAISSYLIESEHYAQQDNIDKARNRLISLTDNEAYKKSEYVPIALFKLALLSERLGREDNLKEANKRIEDLIELVSKSTVPGQAELIFDARLRQGHILRKLNDFPSAQRAYEEIVNKYSRRPDVVVAQLALAETHNAQATREDPSHADKAQLLFEQLRDRADAPADVRFEAAYNLGKLLESRGKPDEAARVWFEDVVTPFLKDAAKPFEAGAKRPYWLARTLLDLGDLRKKRGQIDEGNAAYKLVLELRLPYAEAARARLEQSGVPGPKAAP